MKILSVEDLTLGDICKITIENNFYYIGEFTDLIFDCVSLSHVIKNINDVRQTQNNNIPISSITGILKFE